VKNILFIFRNLISFAQSTDTISELNYFGNNPGNLKMFIHNTDVTDSSLKPLVVVLHGCSQTANGVAELTGWNKIADNNNLIILYPQQKFINNQSLCFNWFKNKDISKGRGESQSIYNAICYIEENYKIDKSKIFITGLSAGAAMAVVMMSVHPETFNSGAVFAGVAYKIASNPIKALNVMYGKKTISEINLAKKVVSQNIGYRSEYPKMIIYQGLEDNIVKPKNSDLILLQWATISKIDTVCDNIVNCYNGVKNITRLEYKKNNDLKIIYYKISGLGHKLLIKPGSNFNEGGKKWIFSEDIGFHSTYQTAIDFGLIK